MPIHKFGHSKEQLQQQFYYDLPIRLVGSLSSLISATGSRRYILRETGSSTYIFNIKSGGEIVGLNYAPLLHINDNKPDISPLGKKLNRGDKLSFTSYSTQNYPTIYVEIMVRCPLVTQK